MIEHDHRCLRLLTRDPWPQPRHNVQPNAAPVGHVVPSRRNRCYHHHRDENVSGTSDLSASKPALRHADDRHRTIIDIDGLIQYRGIAREALLPISITEDYVWLAAFELVIVRRQGSSERRAYAQNIEVISRDELI